MGGIDDDKILRIAMLHIDHAGDENSAIADDHAPRLEHQGRVDALGDALDHRGVGNRVGRIGQIVLIGNAETAAEIDVRDGMTVGAQRADQIPPAA